MAIIYNKSKIYKIVNDIDDDIYIGGTTKHYLSSRLNEHRMQFKKNKTRLLYRKMDNLGITNFKIVLIESFPCNSKDELTAREQYHIDLLKPALNRNRANGRNFEKYREYQKKYYEDHKMKLKNN